MNGETDYERRMSDFKCIELGEKIGYKKGFEAARKQFERPHGEWEYTGCVDDELKAEFCCSICDYCTYSSQYNFCPNCGASMLTKESDKNG